MTRQLAAVLALAFALSSPAYAQQPDTGFGLRLPWRYADSLRIEAPAPFLGAGRLAWPRLSPAVLAARWADSTLARLAARAARRWRAALLGDSALLAVPAPPGLFAPAPELAPVEAGQRGAVLSQVADLGLQLDALFEMRFERLRNLRCTAADANRLGSGCRGGFNPPRIDPQFSVRSGGVVGQRMHVNVDYDSEREFDASNNIQVYYQGLEDEVLRRVQVGNVTFSAPALRFVTGGIPSNNFGVQVEGQLGALDFGAIYAQQRGNVVKDRVFMVGQTTLQPVEREMVDRDFETGRFFFVVDPALLPGYPASDVLSLSEQELPAAARVAQVRIYRRRAALQGNVPEQNLTGIEAVALRDDSPQRAGPFAWELLLEGRDYYLDPSGIWFALVARLDLDDYLAVSWITASGDTVGTFPGSSAAGRVDTLRLVHEPRRGPEVPTFRYELRNAYRVGANDDVERSSVRLSVLVAESEKPCDSRRPETCGGVATFLSLLGLALETDPTTFDQYNRLFPRQRDPGGGAPLRDYFIVLPHLAPFADTARLAPEFRNDSLYRTPAYLLRSQGPTPLYMLRLRYDARGGDQRGNLSLGGFQIREGSERLTVSGRQLVRNVDYTINYEIGQVTFLRPDSMFAQPAAVTVRYEENRAFAIAPTTVFGLQTRYDLGDHGAITALGLFQRERTTFTRPPLGFEPSSNFVGGIAGSFRFEPTRLTRVLDALPLISTDAPSQVTVDAEFATSRPSPNQLGIAYVETFEGEAGTFLPLEEALWGFGSRPSSARGLPGTVFGPVTGFQDSNAVLLTWQNLIAAPAGAAEPIVQFRSQDIDPAIRLQGAGQQAERVLFLALHPDTLGGLLDPATFRPRWVVRPPTDGPRWRSMTLPLSATGVDLTRIEFLEFWVLEDPALTARGAGTSVVFDFGTVFEDAVDFQPDTLTVTTAGDTVYTSAYAGRRRAGQGRLDTERDSLTNAFNAARNDVGILGDVADNLYDARGDSLLRRFPLCQSRLARELVVYTWGSPLTKCTRGNGRADTEDLNTDQRLDTLIAAAEEHLFRYVFRLGDSTYWVRPGGTAPGLGQWRLYRIPFRLDTLVQIGRPELRQVRSLRMTVIVPPGSRPESTITFALARLKLVGAPWVKRSNTPIAGLSGSLGEPHGEVIASVVSTEDLGYEPPPGVTDEGASRGGGYQVGAQQINERSLRLLATEVRPGERAEALFRFPEGARNFLGYRQMRVWARGRGEGWDTGELSFFIKVAHDENNFYLYRAPARTEWEPEVVVDFQTWLALRAQIETRFLRGDAPSGAASCGGDSLAYVACLGPYLVHVRNPGVAPPNLTRVQELAVGFVRDSGVPFGTAELWVDDIRLTGVVDDAGYAGAINVRLTAADVADLAVQASRRDGNFRQLGEDPSYVGSNQLAVSAAVRLEKLGLERLGLTAPLLFRSDRSSQDPYYLNRTDVLAGGLEGLRRPVQTGTSWSVSMSRSRRGTQWWQRALIDNLRLAGAFSSGSGTTELSRSTTRLSDLRGEYAVAPGEVSVPYLPGFVRRALDGLPGFLRRAEFVRGLRDGRLRFTPSQVQFTSGLTRLRSDRFNFRAPIPTPLDTAPPVVSSSDALRNGVRVDLRPFSTMGLGFDYAQERDLKDYGDTTTIGVIAGQSRRSFTGVDVGFERQRTLNTRMSWSPPALSWLRPRFSWQSDFWLRRDPNTREPEREIGDSAGAYRLPSAFATLRTTDLSAAVDLPRALRGLLGDSSRVGRAFGFVTQLDGGRRVERRGQFDRPGFDPGLGFQLGFGSEDGFRAQDGRPANSSAVNVQDRLSAAFRLPLGLSLTTAYAEREGRVWTLRRGSQQLQRTLETDWPNLTARWLWTPRRGSVTHVVSSVTATAGLRKRASVAELPSLEGQLPVRTGQVTRSAPYGVSVSWAPRLTTNLSWGVERSSTDRPGSLTLSDRGQTSADATFSFRIPPEIVPLRSDVRTTLRFTSSRNRTCVQRTDTDPCVPISDSRRHEYNLVMDTSLPPNVTAGLSAGYVLTEDAHVNRKFSQFTLTASVRVALNAGEIR